MPVRSAMRLVLRPASPRVARSEPSPRGPHHRSRAPASGCGRTSFEIRLVFRRRGILQACPANPSRGIPIIVYYPGIENNSNRDGPYRSPSPAAASIARCMSPPRLRARLSQTFVAGRDTEAVFQEYVKPFIGVSWWPIVCVRGEQRTPRCHRQPSAAPYAARAAYAQGRGWYGDERVDRRASADRPSSLWPLPRQTFPRRSIRRWPLPSTAPSPPTARRSSSSVTAGLSASACAGLRPGHADAQSWSIGPSRQPTP